MLGGVLVQLVLQQSQKFHPGSIPQAVLHVGKTKAMAAGSTEELAQQVIDGLR
jgi:hypothetical protein